MNYFMKTNHRHLAVPHTMLGIEGLLVSIPAKNGLWDAQHFTARREFPKQGGRFDICIEYDSFERSNTCNRFTITRNFDGVTGPLGNPECKEFWPELEHLLKWHLCSDGVPMYYFENTLYRGAQGRSQLHLARQCALWPEAPDDLLLGPPNKLKEALAERLPALQEQFRTDLAATGLKLTP